MRERDGGFRRGVLRVREGDLIHEVRFDPPRHLKLLRHGLDTGKTERVGRVPIVRFDHNTARPGDKTRVAAAFTIRTDPRTGERIGELFFAGGIPHHRERPVFHEQRILRPP